MSREAEENIIGSILLDESCIHEIYNTLKPEMFATKYLGGLYNNILAMYDNGEKINIVSLAQKSEDEHFGSDTIANDLKNYCLETEGSYMAKSYANAIVCEYKAAETRKLFERIDLKPNAINGSISEMISRLEELQTSESQKSKSLKEIVAENRENYFKERKVKKIKLGFNKLDDCLGGLEPGDITVVGARPSVGKSALVTQIVMQVAKQGFRVGYFNLEMSDSQVYERMISRQSEIELTRIRRAIAPLNGEMQKFQYANDQIAKLDIVISSGSKTVGEIKSESRHQNFDLIVIDYLQIILSDKSYGNRVSEVGYISKAIKGLAMELKVPIILLSQLSRAVEQREDHEPQMSDLRESGDIEQDASNIIFLWNMTDEENCSMKGLKVDKNRQGTKTKYGLDFDGNTMDFVERDTDFAELKKIAKTRSGLKDTVSDNPFG